MATIKAYSRSSLVTIFLIGVLLLIITAGSIYYGVQLIQKEISAGMVPETTAGQVVEKLVRTQTEYLIYGGAGLLVLFFIFGLLLWLVLRRTARKTLQSAKTQKPAAAATAQADEAERQAARRREQRLFLHLLCVLQREGRLMDFFAEDLGQYEDAQIGAAVRGIHESCKTSMEKALALKPVIDQPEGQETRIEPGFDPHSVKLTGNVAGEPPFTGILRHKGWRAAKVELPTLSDVHDVGIIAPAEVEIT
jgi:hypothetical protein